MNIHFIGIGGIGISALAQYYLAKNYKIRGSDLFSSEIIEFLKKNGAKIFIGEHKSRNVSKDTKLVIYTRAIDSNNPELEKAKRLQIKCLSYPQALGELTKKYYTIAVCGTHGKSTVTAMISLIFIKAGLDPTVIIGTKLKEFQNSNFKKGKSKYLIIEADEWKGSFLNYWPKIIILTNIDKEHLDYYKSLKEISNSYQKFFSHLPKEGILIKNSKYKIKSSQLKCKIKNFSLNQKETKKIKKILKIPGDHNVLNALAALGCARVFGISDRISFKALNEYRGSWRRFEEYNLKIKNQKLKIISDYAHHPTEIFVTLKGAREKYPCQKIWCIFQPHQYQRTFYLFNDFVKVFKKSIQDDNFSKLINKLIITDIFDVPGREDKKIKKEVSVQKLIQEINHPQAFYLPKDQIIQYLKKNIDSKTVIVLMGAGDIYKLIGSFT